MPRRGEMAVVPIEVEGGGGGASKSPSRARRHRHPRPPPPPVPGPEFRPFRRWFPWVVPLFIAANIVLFVLIMYVNDCPSHAAAAAAAIGGGGGAASAVAHSCWLAPELGRFAFQSYKENPLIGPSSSTLLKMGALETSKVTQDHEGWRLITCIWLHAGVVHILANMLSLLLIGIRLEREFGFMRIGALYMISGVGGSLLSALFMQTSISVGASGALFGLLGSMLSELITNWTIYENKLAALLTLVVIIAINLAVGILPHVDNFAHIGGFMSGFFLGFVLLIRPQFGWINQKNSPLGYPVGKSKRKHKTYQIILWVIAAIILISGFTVAFIMLMKGFNASERCSWCHYLSCIPTSRWNCKPQNNYCLSSQLENQLNLTCQSTGKTQTYYLNNPNATDAIRNLCIGLCS